MAVGRNAVAEQIEPLHGSVSIPVKLGATTEAGEIIALQSDGKWDPAIATGAVLTDAVAVQGGGDGDTVDAVVYGPVLCLTGGTVGALVYISDTAGTYSDTAGTKSAYIGFAWDAVTLFVRPHPVVLS